MQLTREERLLQELAEEMKGIAEYMLAGNCENREAYLSSVARYLALADIQTKLKRFFAADDEEGE